MGLESLPRETRGEASHKAPPLAQEVFVQLVKAHARVYNHFAAFLKLYGITEPQFNVLRILRGAGSKGLPCHEIRERMSTRVPDVTRLLDRLEQRGLVQRVRSRRDRRIVRATLRPEAHRLLTRLDGPVLDEHRRHFSHLSQPDLLRLLQLLVRTGLSSP
jgi:DNA-binding MarR family transcriptional regulator